MLRLEPDIEVGKYTLMEFQGQGTTAEVWSAKDSSDNIVALKIFAPKSNLDSNSKKLLLEEYNRTKLFKHKNIVPFIDYFEEDKTPIIVMPLYETSMWDELILRMNNTISSESIVSRLNLFSEEEFARLIKQIGGALHKLHSLLPQKYIHQDIKPQNFLINKNDGLLDFYLTDFGITREVRDTILKQTRGSSSSSGLTFAYAAPERLNNTDSSNCKSDIFSLGASILEITNGIGEISPGQILNNNGFIPNLEGQYSKRFVELVKSCMSKEPEKRPTAKTLRDYAINYLDGKGWPELKNSKDTMVMTPSVNSVGKTLNWQQQTPEPPINSLEEQIEDSVIHTGEVKTKFSKWWMLLFVIPIFVGAYFLFSGDQEKYDTIYPFIDGHAIVRIDNKCGIINESHEEVEPVVYRLCLRISDQNIELKRFDNTTKIYSLKQN